MTVLQFWTHFHSLDGSSTLVSMRIFCHACDRVKAGRPITVRDTRVPVLHYPLVPAAALVYSFALSESEDRARKLCPDSLFESQS